MDNISTQEIWVSVLVKRGFITDVKAYSTRAAALAKESEWRRDLNPDYDEAGSFRLRVDDESLLENAAE